METKQQYSELNSTRHNNVSKELLNTIESRFYLLNTQDRILMSMYMDKELSFRQIALLLKASPSSIARRIKKIKCKLMQTNYFVFKQIKNLSRFEVEIAKDYFINGLSIKQIAKKKNASFYHIREVLEEIRHTIQKEKL